MNPRQYQQIEKHGNDLLRIFPRTAITDPLKLSKRLYRLEGQARRLCEDYCNGVGDVDDWGCAKARILHAVDKVLRFTQEGVPVFINGDPRGYSLKIPNTYVQHHNLEIHQDWGGYGILAPTFDGKL